MKLFHILGFTEELVFGSSTSVTRRNDISQFLTINQEIFFDQSHLIILVSFLVFSC